MNASFVRDRLTWLCYAVLGSYAYLQAILGPVLPFLRDELNLSYGVAGLHTTAYAFGMMMAGVFGGTVARRFRRQVTFWGGGFGAIIAMTAFILGRSPVVTISAIFCAGMVGTFLLNAINSTLSDHHGMWRSFAITEANIAASVFVFFAPLFAGGLEGVGLDWRGAILIAFVVFFGLFWWGRHEPIPSAKLKRAEDGHKVAPLPRLFWGYWGLMVICVAIEWCVNWWAADFLRSVVGIETALASGLISVLALAMIAGRIVGSRLVRRYPPRHVLWLTVGFLSLGFPLFWLAQVAWLNVLGLFLCGLGISSQFPLLLSMVTGIAADQVDLATARVAIGTGLAMLVMPQVLASLADAIGLFSAFGVVIVLLLGVIGLLTFISRRAPLSSASPHIV